MGLSHSHLRADPSICSPFNKTYTKRMHLDRLIEATENVYLSQIDNSEEKDSGHQKVSYSPYILLSFE